MGVRMRLVTTILPLLFCLPFPAFSQPPAEIVIGLIPEMNVFKQMERYRPLAEYLAEQSGVPIRLTILSRYGNLIDSFQKQEIDGAFFGSFTGALAIEKLQVTPLARPVNLNGESTYRGYLFTRKDSGIRTAAEMKNKRLAFVEKATTAGYVFPLAYFRSNGIPNPDDYFRETFFAGSHDATVYAVLEGKADVGAAKNTIFDWVRTIDPRIDQEIRILATSSAVPSNGLCVRKSLDEPTKARLRQILLELDSSPQGKSVLEKLGALKFIETSAEDYQPVFEMANKAGIDLRRYDYVNQ